jgi:16S rRNA processing protein RimM
VPDADRLEVGRVTKPHGILGDVIVTLLTNRPERLDAGATLESDRGPLVVAAARPHQDRWIVRFEGVADRTGAEALAGTVLYAQPLDDDDALWVHDLIGAEVVTVDGVARGRVTAVEDNPAHDLLVLDDGTLVPIVFVTGWAAPGRLAVDPPPGLFDP